MTPLAIDLFCGLGGWTEGLLAEGYRVVGFDIERHVYGAHKYPAQLVLQDVLTIHGRQFRNADLIVASPPCQEYNYMAMPWTIAKEKQAEYESGVRDVKQLTALFDACFQIQREAIEASGRFIPHPPASPATTEPLPTVIECDQCGLTQSEWELPLVVCATCPRHYLDDDSCDGTIHEVPQ